MVHLQLIRFTLGTWLALLAFTLVANAQVQVVVNVAPPYSTQARDYLQQGNNVAITLINPSQRSYQLRLLVSLAALNNQVEVAMRNDYQPPVPIVLGAQQTRTLTLHQLKAIHSNFTANDVVVSGVSRDAYLSGGSLPEGMYKLCVKAVVANDPAGGGGGVSEGCATFQIKAFEAPIILNPQHQGQVQPLQPQFVNFSWTPTGQPGTTRYTFKLVDLTTANVFNPNDAFNGNVLPWFQQSNLTVNSLQMDNSKPKLIPGHQYAVEVTAYDVQKKLNYKNQGRSQVISFTYQDGMVQNQPAPLPPGKAMEDAPKGPCLASTLWQGDLTKQPKDGLPNGTHLAVGYFVIKNTVFTNTKNGYTGTGEVLVHFLNSRIKVEFAGIKVNADNRVYEGKVTAAITAANLINEAMSKAKEGAIDQVPQLQPLLQTMAQANRQVASIVPGMPMDLPLTYKKNDLAVGIVGLIFEPKEAYVNTLLHLPFATLPLQEYVLLSAKGIRIHPNGYADAEVKLGLAQSRTVAMAQGKMYLTITGGAEHTYASFDCGGVKEVKVTGNLAMDRSLLLPLNAQWQVINDAKVQVQVPFSFSTQNNFDDFVLENLAISHPFVVPGFTDFAIKPTTIALDLSAVKNIGNFLANDKTWSGIYFKNLDLLLPDMFSNTQQQRVSVSFSDMFISKQGFTGNFSIEKNPIVAGGLGGFGYKLHKLGLSILNNAVTGGSLSGEIDLPLGKNASAAFTGTISKGPNVSEIGISVSTLEEIEADLFLARIKMLPNSVITIKRDEQNKVSALATLHGTLGINFSKNPGNSNVSAFELPHVDFQNLTIQPVANGVPSVSVGAIGLQSKNKVQASVGGFELNLNDINFKKVGNELGLSLDLGLTLFGGDNNNSNGAGGQTAFTVWADYKPAEKTFAYKKTTLEKIVVDADLGAALVKGNIEIFNQDSTYGNGFRGNVQATLRGLGAQVGVQLQFGKTLPAKGAFKYWYFDAMASFGNIGINIPGTAASIYGFGGGAWANMVPKTPNIPTLLPNQYKAVSKGGEGAPTTSGQVFIPQQGTFGFSASVLFGITGSQTAFNGDLKFSMTLTNKLAVNNVRLQGNAFLMQDPTNIAVRQDPSKAMVRATALIDYDAPTNCLSGNFGATVNVGGVIEGGGQISFKFDMPARDKYGNLIHPNEKTKWFIKVGQWTPGAEPFDDNARINARIGFDAKAVKAEIKFQTYFMVGNDLPATLPAIPTYIHNLIKSQGMSQQAKAMPAATGDEANLVFAFGAGYKINAGFDFKVISAELDAAVGFDVMLANIKATCDGKQAGFNGWYAQGQAYAYLTGNMKLFRKVSVAEFVAGAVLDVKLPNPNWVRGTMVAYIDVLGVKAGSYTGTFEKGTLCGNFQKEEFDPLGKLKLVKGVYPAHQTKAVDPYIQDIEVSLAFAYGNGGSGSAFHAFDAYNNKEYTWWFTANIELRDKQGSKIPVWYMVSDATPNLVTLRPKQILKENTEYTIHVGAKLENAKYQGNFNKLTEIVQVKFATGQYPQEIKMKDVGDAYPLPNQRYAMRKDASGNPMMGRLHLKRDMTYFVTKYQNDYQLFIRLRKAGTQQNIDVHYQAFDADAAKAYLDNTLVYNLPPQLEKSTIYHMSLVLKPKKKGYGLQERVIFEGYHFRTSAYESLKEKFAALSIKRVGYLKENRFIYLTHTDINEDIYAPYQVPVLIMEAKEGFDQYEYNGYAAQVNQNLPTKGSLWHAYENSLWLNTVKTQILELATPKLSTQEKSLLKSVADFTAGGKDLFHVKYSKGLPFSNELGYPFSTQRTAGFLSNISWHVAELQKAKALLPGEQLSIPKGPLTTQEIEKAEKAKQGGGMQQQVNNNIKNAIEPVSYWALADYTFYKAMLDSEAIFNKWLINSKSKAERQNVWNILKKLGFPAYPKGQKTLNLVPPVGGGEKQQPFLQIKYNYAP